MDCRADGAEEEENERSSSPAGLQSPVMDRNPSPPPEAADEKTDGDVDAIGETVYSKHWLFSTLTRLIHMVTEHSEVNSEDPMQLPDDDEEDLCRVWDMAMDKDVAAFLQEFKATDILLGVIAKSRCQRLTGCAVASAWRYRSANPSGNLPIAADLRLSERRLFPVAPANTSADVSDLLEKVGELLDKLFDLDEELMKSWITAQPSGGEEDEDDDDNGSQSHLDVASCLLEAAKQLRSESPNGLEVYLHALQLLTTVDEGIQTLAAPDGPGKAVWDFVCDVVCEDLCQPTDLPAVLREEKSILVQALAVLQALYRCQDEWCSRSDISLPLIGTVLRVLQFHSEDKDDGTKDEQLQTLAEIAAEFLADICSHISTDTVADLVKNGYLTEKTSLTAAGSLAPNFRTSFQQLQSMLSETDPQMADTVRKQFPV
ncbi:Protein saal1 [Liparis tanakae]|uniref:Protein saal1 n=1 Tax=Liparis tanakae TaxID=230148 RepID=A0A4Z2JBK6_9TELE|nr:Protein saal1 [Liparis tanakae]